MSMKGLVGLVVLLALAACGSETDDPEPRADDTPVAEPTEIPEAPGPVRTVAAVTVLDDGDGAELCLGGVAESLPPQCGGPKLIGWDWSEHEGDYEEVRGTRWGDFGVTGTFDGTDVHPTDAVPADEYEEAPYDDPFDVDLTTPCDEPEGGWRVLDPALTTDQIENEVMRVARNLDDYAGSWVDQSINPMIDQTDSPEWEQSVNDPTKLIVNIQVTGDPAVAEERLREVWGGALCVSRAEHTQDELFAIQDEIRELPGILGFGVGLDQVIGDLIYDDGSIKAWLDQEYGEDVVHLAPVLVDAE